MCSEYHVLAIDGPSGIGKSSIIAPVIENLHSQGVSATPFSNNESTPFAAAIRELAAGSHRPLSLALATAAARAFLLEMNTDKLLVSDRHILSTLVYQVLDGVSLDYLRAINEPFISSTHFILLEVSATTLSARRAARAGRGSDRFKKALTAEREIELYHNARDSSRQ